MEMVPAGPWRARWKFWTSTAALRAHEDKLLLLLTVIIGAIVGLVIVAFILVTEELGSRMYPPESPAWRRVLIPIAGALVAGILLKRFFPEARGSGIPQTKAALFLYDGFINLWAVTGRFICSSITLASGIALGREGPSVHLGAGISSVLSRRLGLSDKNIKLLFPVGTAAALSAAFNTPIAAVLFSLEEILGDLHAPVLGSIVLSAATSWMILHLLLGDEPLFHVPPYQLVHPLEFGIYALLGLAGGLVSVGFVRLLLWLRKHFLRMPQATQWAQPVAGAALVGVLGGFVPQVLGVGYGYVGQALNGQMLPAMMALLVTLKIAATATCYASGNAGGVFGPSLFIGAMLGGAVGGTAHTFLPDYTGTAGAYALVGMGTAFAGIIRVPLTSVIMIFEITRDYSIIVPLMISNLVSYFVSLRLQKEPIYEALQHQEGMHLPSGRRRDPLLSVADGMRAAARVIPATATLAEALPRPGDTSDAWPVVDGSGLLIGMLALDTIRARVQEGWGAAPVSEVIHSPPAGVRLTAENFPHLHRDHSLDTALSRMARSRLNVLPVVSRANVRRIEGVISLTDVLGVYGLGAEGPREPDSALRREEAPGAVLVGIAAALIGVFTIIAVIEYVYRIQRRERAQEHFETAGELLRRGRLAEGIEQYRNALSISRSPEHRLALAQALIRAGQPKEAGIYLRELTQTNPTDGEINLARARIAAQENRTADAVTAYRQAIYGSWPNRDRPLEVRFELADLLGKTGSTKQAIAELLDLVQQVRNDPVLEKRAAHALFRLGAFGESERIFRAITRESRGDAEAWAAVGEAEFAQENYASARHAFRRAVELNPSNKSAQGRLNVSSEILERDPTLRGLTPAERLQRSRSLLAQVLEMLEPGQLEGSARDLAVRARRMLGLRYRRSVFAGAADMYVSTTAELWRTRPAACAPQDSETAVGIIMRKLSASQ